MGSFFLILLSHMREGLYELILGSIDRILLLEEGIQLIFLSLSIGVLLHVDGVLEDFGIVHRAPTDEAAVVGERWELVLLYIAMNSLLDVKVFAHLYNLNKTKVKLFRFH